MPKTAGSIVLIKNMC